MHVLLRSAKKRTRPGMCKSLSNRIDRLRPIRRSPRAGSGAGAAITTKWLQRCATLRSNGNVCPRHSRVLLDPRRTGSVRITAEAGSSNNLFEVSVDLSFCDSDRILHCGAIGIRIFLMMKRSQRIIAEVADLGLEKTTPSTAAVSDRGYKN